MIWELATALKHTPGLSHVANGSLQPATYKDRFQSHHVVKIACMQNLYNHLIYYGGTNIYWTLYYFKVKGKYEYYMPFISTLIHEYYVVLIIK